MSNAGLIRDKRLFHQVMALMLLLPVFTASSCVSRTEIKQLKKESYDTYNLTARIDTTSRNNNQALQEMQGNIELLENEVRTLKGMVGASLAGDSYSVDDQYDRLESIERILKQLMDRSGDVEERWEGRQLFEAAYRDMRLGNLPLSIDEFTLFLDKFSDSPRADDAMYYVGECWIQMDSVSTALNTFKSLVDQYPSGDMAPPALLEMGVVQENTGDTDGAGETYRFLADKYPDSREGGLARQRLELLIDDAGKGDNDAGVRGETPD